MIAIEGSDPQGLIPPEIDSLLGTGLTDFRTHYGLATHLSNIAGYPNLLVRTYDKSEDFLPETAQGLTAAYQAERYGVSVLPSKLYVAHNRQYVVTTKVKGRTLTDLLANEPNAENLRRADMLHASLGSYVMGQMNRGGLVADDIYTPGQYMVGTTLGDEQHKVRLVDLPDGARNLIPGPKTEEKYNRCVMDWVNGIIETESRANTYLELSRIVAAKVFNVSSRTHRGSEWVDAFEYAIETHELLDTDDPPISELVTY